MSWNIYLIFCVDYSFGVVYLTSKKIYIYSVAVVVFVVVVVVVVVVVSSLASDW